MSLWRLALSISQKKLKFVARKNCTRFSIHTIIHLSSRSLDLFVVKREEKKVAYEVIFADFFSYIEQTEARCLTIAV
jgi:hypothetical protein